MKQPGSFFVWCGSERGGGTGYVDEECPIAVAVVCAEFLGRDFLCRWSGCAGQL